jgi:hypothetical protein
MPLSPKISTSLFYRVNPLLVYEGKFAYKHGMAHSDAFEAALREARKSLSEAYDDRAAIEQRIVSLKQTIDGLTNLCEPEPFFIETQRRDTETGFDIRSKFRLSFAIRQIFSESESYTLTPTEVRDALLKIDVNFAERYKQPLVPIHNTLKRFEAQGELVAIRDDSGAFRGYRWVSPLARAVAEVDPVQQLGRGTRFRSPGASGNIRNWIALNGSTPKK